MKSFMSGFVVGVSISLLFLIAGYIVDTQQTKETPKQYYSVDRTYTDSSKFVAASEALGIPPTYNQDSTVLHFFTYDQNKVTQHAYFLKP